LLRAVCDKVIHRRGLSAWYLLTLHAVIIACQHMLNTIAVEVQQVVIKMITCFVRMMTWRRTLYIKQTLIIVSHVTRHVSVTSYEVFLCGLMVRHETVHIHCSNDHAAVVNSPIG